MISYANKPTTEEEESLNSNISPKKRPRLEKLKGVVPQPNGHWGAQIYANHERIWLGTFGSQVDAAMAYDSASIKLRSGDSHKNFPLSDTTSLLETKFQMLFTTNAVLGMIRDGSYPSKFADFSKHQSQNRKADHDPFSCTLLFQKELTPSDVGKLNRLVIPKRYAVLHFPSVPDSQNTDEVQLEFYDRKMRLWKFRYCYWKSSQSFVFTRGWNRFVREKGLRPNDTIAFYMCNTRFGQSFLVIDVVWKKSGLGDGNEDHNVKVGDGDTFFRTFDHSTPNHNSKGFRLFGVQIVD
ncbi:AP2/ERF and B3 domain-containing transcription factor [Striga hermonthica]|uniref:AP2/ERF and B3 domain-containing transcription factor n=1 Tax=Striga hermonthica TaxID=68872 RepID=A0A9N7NE69_STRHE|nr:AP2/ERF and B3 domain-containing transcription factor [Striga hermonthica]